MQLHVPLQALQSHSVRLGWNANKQWRDSFKRHVTLSTIYKLLGMLCAWHNSNHFCSFPESIDTRSPTLACHHSHVKLSSSRLRQEDQEWDTSRTTSRCCVSLLMEGAANLYKPVLQSVTVECIQRLPANDVINSLSRKACPRGKPRVWWTSLSEVNDVCTTSHNEPIESSVKGHNQTGRSHVSRTKQKKEGKKRENKFLLWIPSKCLHSLIIRVLKKTIKIDYDCFNWFGQLKNLYCVVYYLFWLRKQIDCLLDCYN